MMVHGRNSTPQITPRISQTTQPSELGAKARAAMIGMVRDKDPGAVDRFFAETFVQHDVALSDGVPGMREYAAEIAASAAADLIIYRTLEDGEFVLLHSKYIGLRGHPTPMIAFDLFRFADGKIAEHWGGQEPEAPPNPSGRSQVDGPAVVTDRDISEENCALVRQFKEIVTVQLRFDRVDEFIQGDNYIQHASKVGDGTDRMKSRIASVAKSGSEPALKPRRYIADGNFVLALVEAKMESGSTANYDLFRVENGWIVEHWDVISQILSRDKWRNANGPF
jgi:predicted SnoaL-like aldol condensation-catalyzing enzyme